VIARQISSGAIVLTIAGGSWSLALPGGCGAALWALAHGAGLTSASSATGRWPAMSRSRTIGPKPVRSRVGLSRKSCPAVSHTSTRCTAVSYWSERKSARRPAGRGIGCNRPAETPPARGPPHAGPLFPAGAPDVSREQSKRQSAGDQPQHARTALGPKQCRQMSRLQQNSVRPKYNRIANGLSNRFSSLPPHTLC